MSSLSALGKLGAAAGVFAVLALASEYKQGTLFPAHAVEGGSAAGVPGQYLALYRDAADACDELDWALLAAVGKVETDHGRSTLPGVTSGSNAAGAAGPMQFLPATFAAVRAQHPEVGGDIYDPAEAIPAAAHYLCDSGLDGGDEYAAIFSYNHADWYVDKVLDRAAAYRDAA